MPLDSLMGVGLELHPPRESLLRISPRLSGFPGGRVYPDGPEGWRASAGHIMYATHIVNPSEDDKAQLRLAMKAATDDEAQSRLAKTNVRLASLPEPAADMPAAVMNVDEKSIHMKTGGRNVIDSDTDTDPGEKRSLLSILESTGGPLQE